MKISITDRSIIGKRLLIRDGYGISDPLVEGRVREISPSGTHIKLDVHGSASWVTPYKYSVIEVLE